jgi:hypothetical protein
VGDDAVATGPLATRAPLPVDAVGASTGERPGSDMINFACISCRRSRVVVPTSRTIAVTAMQCAPLPVLFAANGGSLPSADGDRGAMGTVLVIDVALVTADTGMRSGGDDGRASVPVGAVSVQPPARDASLGDVVIIVLVLVGVDVTELDDALAAVGGRGSRRGESVGVLRVASAGDAPPTDAARGSSGDVDVDADVVVLLSMRACAHTWIVSQAASTERARTTPMRTLPVDVIAAAVDDAELYDSRALGVGSGFDNALVAHSSTYRDTATSAHNALCARAPLLRCTLMQQGRRGARP